MSKLVLGTPAIRGLVGEEDGSAAHAEETVGDKHRTVVA